MSIRGGPAEDAGAGYCDNDLLFRYIRLRHRSNSTSGIATSEVRRIRLSSLRGRNRRIARTPGFSLAIFRGVPVILTPSVDISAAKTGIVLGNNCLFRRGRRQDRPRRVQDRTRRSSSSSPIRDESSRAGVDCRLTPIARAYGWSSRSPRPAGVVMAHLVFRRMLWTRGRRWPRGPVRLVGHGGDPRLDPGGPCVNAAGRFVP